MREGWEYKKLGEVCNIYQPKTISTEQLVEDGDYLVYGANGIIGRYDKYNHEESEVLMTCRGATCGTINVSEPFSWINGNAMVVHPLNDLVEKSYLSFCLRGIKLSDVITGAAQPQITRQKLSPKIIPVPPLSVQQSIVSELDMLSGLIAKHEEQLKAYDELAQSIFYDMFGDPVENEKGWEVKKLEEIGTIITGSTPSTRDENNYSSNDYNFFKPSDIANDTISLLTESEYFISEHAYEQSRKLPIGSVLVTCIGIIGKIGILQKEATCNQQINAVKPNDNTTPLYLAYCISGLRVMLENIANAPVVPIINKGQFSNIQIPLPPLLLQQSFAEKIEAIERQKERIRQSMAEVKTLFDSRMDYYFN